MNIEIAPDIQIDALKGKPFMIKCEIAVDADGKPVLQSTYPFTLKPEGDHFRLQRAPERKF